MPRTKAGLRESTFADGAADEPHAITAHADCIQLHFGDAGAEVVVTLRPRHILSVQHMAEDWWDSHWATVHEAEA